MAGIRLEVGLQDQALRRAIRRAAAFGDDPRAALDASGQLLVSSTRERFDTGVGPDGIPWPPSGRVKQAALPNPKARRKRDRFGPRQGGKTLRDKGALVQSIRHEVTGKAVEVGSDARAASGKYAAIHQTGGTIRPKKGEFLVFTGADGGLVFARQVTIPARPYLGIDAGDLVDLEALWTDRVKELWDARG